MATITNDDEFVLACNYLVLTNQLTVQGERFINAAARLVIDEQNGGNVDITPDTPTLESALDGAIADMAARETVASVQANAKTQAAAIPNWASWTVDEALTWHDTNITNAIPVANLAAANVVLDRLATENRALVRMVIALRNAQYPDLQG
jgi:hypothetical protein